MVVDFSAPFIILIMVMLIWSHTRQVVMATVNTDVLMIGICHMGMCMTQRCQHQADAHEETEHAQQRGHRRSVSEPLPGWLSCGWSPSSYERFQQPELTFTLG
jgi:hypothetical protein